ncbi:hypothetical protein L2E82_35097 [Cichorium intybus]|uniref:Uncharacterized protein n=1 Tax=Cichorium intybus TaxID=13427 RepID=A0ACB9BN86_CICIN|nr:hypothetical protein L2E82_35097 [Cichorium intybus]
MPPSPLQPRLRPYSSLPSPSPLLQPGMLQPSSQQNNFHCSSFYSDLIHHCHHHLPYCNQGCYNHHHSKTTSTAPPSLLKDDIVVDLKKGEITKGHGEDEEGTGSNLRLKPVNLMVCE